MKLTAVAIVTGAGLVMVDTVVRGLRNQLLSPVDRPLVLWQSIKVNAFGEAAAAVTPARIGGDITRFAGFNRCGFGNSATLALLGVEKIIDYALIGMVTVILSVFLADSARGGVDRLIAGASAPTARFWAVVES